MKTLCLIHSYPGAAETLALLWPGFKRSGYDLVGVNTIDGLCLWPEPIPTITIGRNIHWLNDRRSLPTRMVNSFRYFLSTEYDQCFVCEYDSYFHGKPPEFPAGFVCNHVGGQLPDSDALYLLASPWIADREAARLIVEHGTDLILEGACEKGPHGSPDVFLSLVVQRAGMSFTHAEKAYTANTIEGEPYLSEARKALANGAVFFHGVKTQQQLDDLLT